jgi:hypothetical protein
MAQRGQGQCWFADEAVGRYGSRALEGRKWRSGEGRAAAQGAKKKGRVKKRRSEEAKKMEGPLKGRKLGKGELLWVTCGLGRGCVGAWVRG